MNKHYLTKGRLNKMCKYFKNKKVKITYIYNNSLGHHNKRSIVCKYDSFTVEKIQYDYNIGYYLCIIKFKKKNQVIWEQTFDGCGELADDRFIGLGTIEENNSGPYCYFQIKRVKL